MVIDLANNDRDPEQLGRELDAMARFNQSRGIRTLIILEPNTIENRRSLLFMRNQVLADAGAIQTRKAFSFQSLATSATSGIVT